MSEVKTAWFQGGFVAGIITTIAVFYLWLHHEPQKAKEQAIPDSEHYIREVKKYSASGY